MIAYAIGMARSVLDTWAAAFATWCADMEPDAPVTRAEIEQLMRRNEQLREEVRRAREG